MSDPELASPSEETPHEAPAIAPPAPTVSRRDIWIGAGGLVIGMAIGALGVVLIGLLASSAASVVKTEPMTDAAAACGVSSNAWITVGDNGQSISMKSEGTEDAGASMVDIYCVLDELQVTDSVTRQIEATRALDGRLTGTWSHFTASWGYHPDHGLDIIVDAY